MQVVTLAGSPGARSRSTSVLDLAANWLQARGVELSRWRIQDFPAADLIGARFDSPPVVELIAQLQAADGLVIATPVYKASLAGALKTLLDLLPERALSHKVVLPLATAGSSGHLLAIDYALKPVLSALKAQEILNGVFADDSQVSYTETGVALTPALEQRLYESLEQFHAALARRPQPLTPELLADRIGQARWGI